LENGSNAKNTLEDFRQKIKLDQIWPPPITHIINFIHHMQTAIAMALLTEDICTALK
jgi:hypothetical protein